jgi:hypothetical protein
MIHDFDVTENYVSKEHSLATPHSLNAFRSSFQLFLKLAQLRE